MEKLLVVNKVANEVTENDIKNVADGDLFLILQNKDITNSQVAYFGSNLTKANLEAARSIQFAVKRNGNIDTSIVINLDRISNANVVLPSLGVASVIKLGNNAASSTALSIPSTGEGNIRIVDLIELYNVDNFPANISVVKRVSETALQYLQRVVLAINNDPIGKTLVTALLESAGTNYQIKLTAKHPLIKLGVSVEGIFENYIPITVEEREIPVGSGTDLALIEKELSVFKGNGNYMNMGDIYYKEPMFINSTANYKVASITSSIFASPTPSTNMALGSYNILIAQPYNKNVTPVDTKLEEIIAFINGTTLVKP
jgi:hypothetical protein